MLRLSDGAPMGKDAANRNAHCSSYACDPRRRRRSSPRVSRLRRDLCRLRRPGNGAKMRAMSLARSSRSVIALVTAFLLLLCQTAFAAQACAQTIMATGASSASAPCHESSGADHGAPAGSAAVSGCEAGKAVGDGAKVQIIALADLPAVTVNYPDTTPRRALTEVAQVVHSVCHSPPLSILHCRLRN